MTTLKEISIPETQLKLRWREPYVTDGTNKALATLDPGAYRGGYVRETDPISTSFRLTAEGEADNCFLWVDQATGTALAIRYGTDVLFDMAPRFSGPGGTLPSAQTWYVWLDCSYSVGAATTGKFYVGDAAPTSANAVRIARINMPNGATAILSSYIDWSTTYRTVAHVDRPILLARRVSRAVSTNKFQLTGQVYFPSGSASWMLREMGIQLSETSGLTRLAYTGDDGGSIWVKQIWADSALSVPITSDSEGFVLDPWVELDLSQTADPTPPSCWVRYWTRGTLRDLVLNDEIVADWVPHEHAASVATREKAGYPTPLVRGTVQSQIETLLAAVNDRISAQAPESAPAAPVLLWRSHNVASDALVTGTTISMYWGTNLGFAVIVGGYISGGNAVRALVSPGDTMVLLRLHGNLGAGPELLSSPAAAGATRAWNIVTDWTAGLYTTDFFGVPLFTMPALLVQLLSVTLGITLDSSPLLLTNHESYVKGNTPGAGGLDTYCRLFESNGTGSKVRLYYGNGSFWMTYNAEWDQGSGKWYEDDATKHALGIGMAALGRDPSFSVSKKFLAGFGSGWALWDSTILYGAEVPSGYLGYGAFSMVNPVALGDCMDICKWCLHATPGQTDGIYVYTAVTFHVKFSSVPNFAFVDIQEEVGPWTSSATEAVLDSVDEYGLVIQGVRGIESIIDTHYTWGRVFVFE